VQLEEQEGQSLSHPKSGERSLRDWPPLAAGEAEAEAEAPSAR